MTEVLPDEVRAAYDGLRNGLLMFMESMQNASNVGIDVSAAITQVMRDSMGEAFDELPPMVRMMLA